MLKYKKVVKSHGKRNSSSLLDLLAKKTSRLKGYMSSKPVFYDGVADHEPNNILNVFIAMTDNYTDYPVYFV